MEPPHGRGKGISYVLVSEELGITPAWAGKRLSLVTPYNPPSDYPRAGGEKVNPTGNDWYTQGSPPHRRGKAKFEVNAGPHFGITPA